jgi:hypothetical protein
MLTNREVILIKVEATYGTDAVPVEGTDAVLVENPSWANEGLRMNERPAVRANIDMLQHVYGGRLATITFDVELKGGGGAVDVPPEIAPCLLGCGFAETINVASNVEYDPVSTGHDSVTIYYFQDGVRYIITGARGNVSFNLETGAVGKTSFTFTGHVALPTDVALASPTYDGVVPVALINVPFTVGAYGAVINALSFDMSNTIATPPDISASDGYSEVQLTQRDCNGSFDPEAVVVATDFPLQDLEQGNTLALDTGVVGSAVGNRYQITMPAIYYRDVSPGDRDGVRTLDTPFGATSVTGDDEVQLTFT